MSCSAYLRSARIFGPGRWRQDGPLGALTKGGPFVRADLKCPRKDTYRPRKTGFCLATKAAVDVRWSSVAPIATCSSDSFASASVSVEAAA